MMKRFSQQRYNESQGQGYLDKKGEWYQKSSYRQDEVLSETGIPRQETVKGGGYQKISYRQDKVILETGISGQETGKWWRYQIILYCQGRVMVTSIRSEQEKPGGI